MLIKFFFLLAAIVALSSAHPQFAAVIGTQAQSYNAHAINHAYGLAPAVPAVSAYSLYPSPGYIGYSPYSAPLVINRR